MTVEHDLNCAILIEESITEAAALGIKADFFTDTIERRVYEIIEEHLLRHHKVPGIDVVRSAYPNYAYAEPAEPVSYYSHKLQGEYLYRIWMDGISEAMQRIDDPGFDGFALKAMMDEAAYQANLGAAEGAVVDMYSTNREFFLREYPLNQKLGYLRGISTGFTDLDKVTGGYQPGQLIVLFGLEKSGKSTMMQASAASAKREFYNPMFVTFEMGTKDMRWRSISLQSGVSLTGLRDGQLPPPEAAHVDITLKHQESIFGYTMIEDRKSMYTVGSVNQKIIEVKPDIVFIDGFYWMNAPGMIPKSNEAITFLTRELKQLAMDHQIPIVISTQALSSRSRGGLRAESVGYSSALRQDCDILVGVYTKTATLSDFDVLLNRNGPTAHCYVRIDWNRGLIEQEDHSVALAEIEAKASGTSAAGGTWSP